MTYTVSITSQGQISIPAKLRRKYGLDKKGKALISEEEDKLIIEPVPDLLSLRGSLNHKAIKGKSIDEIIALENKAIEEGMFAEKFKYLRKRKK